MTDLKDRQDRVVYYQSWTRDKLLQMKEEDLFDYIGRLWAMLIWGNKRYVVEKLIQENKFDDLKSNLSRLIWDQDDIQVRWDSFRSEVKGMGPAMMSEILCHVHPTKHMIWNRRAYVGLRYLGVSSLPKYNYQCDGEKYVELCKVAEQIAEELRINGIIDATLLTVDYFIWDELQVEDNLTQVIKSESEKNMEISAGRLITKEFIHNEIRDNISDIGQWLGFSTRMEAKVAEGSVVDTVWEATIGNMGRIIYVFEVQTKGSIDSLILNLLKSLNNPAVQGVVAVSDEVQLEKIKKHAESVGDLGKKLKYWNYKEVMQNHEALSFVYESINKLGLVPQGF